MIKMQPQKRKRQPLLTKKRRSLQKKKIYQLRQLKALRRKKKKKSPQLRMTSFYRWIWMSKAKIHREY